MTAQRPGETPPIYLGDGVYASFDGVQIWLRTERETGVHEIALESHVFRALQSYADALSDHDTGDERFNG